MTKRIIIYIITTLLSFNAIAQSNNNTSSTPKTFTTSFGVPDCGEWMNKTRPGSDRWLSGYLSGLNQMHNTVSSKQHPAYDPLDELSSIDQAIVWMDNWCRANPLSLVDEGAFKLFVELVQKKIK